MKYLIALLILAAACGGQTVQYDCPTDRQQLCTPAHSMPFCCPSDAVCGTGSDYPDGGNGCPEGTCCPSPVSP